MNSIFDTSAVIGAVERRSHDLVTLIAESDGPSIRSVTVLGELQLGAELAVLRSDPARVTTLERYERLTEWSDAETELAQVSRNYALVAQTAVVFGSKANMNDRWIIADALTHHAARFVTSDIAQGELARSVFETEGRATEVVVAQ